MLNAKLDISVIENCLCVDLCNIQAYAVTFTDYGFCLIIIVTKLFTEGNSFDCIRPMVNFLILRSWSHRNNAKM